MPVYPFTKAVNSDKLAGELAAASFTGFVINTSGSTCGISFASDLSSDDQAILSALVNNHVPLTTAESLAIYLDKQVFPFIKNLLNVFAAENIALGITQAGKTADLLGLFQKSYDLGALHPVSLKASMDTGSLYVSRAIIQYVRDNPTEYTGLSPFVTDARLLAMKNEIETFLGISPLST